MSWLDSLARRAAGGGSGAGSRPPVQPAGSTAPGTTRRRALRLVAGAAGAVAVSGPLRLLQPSTASAYTTCGLINMEETAADFRACVKGPLEEFEETNEVIQEKEDLLRAQKKPAARRRLRKLIEDLTRRRNRALKNIEFCNGAFAQDRAEGEAKCQASNPPSGEAGSGGGTGGGSVGCEAGFVLCGPENYCCNTNNAYCQGCNGKPICCRLEADCCPSG
jgi:hypothetical protein